MSPTLNTARELIRKARCITVLTGAGISAESGIPTFRGVAGLWKQFVPEDLATPQAFARDPKLVWEWYDWRRSLIASAKPNAGHKALAEIEERSNRFSLVTQNVDGLHQLAGSKDVLEIHGSIWLLRCTKCGSEWIDRSIPLEILPSCTCNGLARPGVVWFGENLTPDVWERAVDAAVSCDCFLVVGTSAIVYPAASLVPLAKSGGAQVIEINIEKTPVSEFVDCTLRGAAGEILPELVAPSPRT